MGEFKLESLLGGNFAFIIFLILILLLLGDS